MRLWKIFLKKQKNKTFLPSPAQSKANRNYHAIILKWYQPVPGQMSLTATYCPSPLQLMRGLWSSQSKAGNIS